MDNGIAELAALRVGSDAAQKAHAERDSEMYLTERRLAAEAYRDGEKSYDQWLLTMSSSALGLSLVFLKDIAHPPVVATALIIIAWLSFGCAIILLLINLRVSADLHFKFIGIYDKYFAPARYDPSKDAWPAIRAEQQNVEIEYKLGSATLTFKGMSLMDNLNRASLVLFVSGILFLGIFVYRNLH